MKMLLNLIVRVIVAWGRAHRLPVVE